jgi:polyphenol oxidase
MTNINFKILAPNWSIPNVNAFTVLAYSENDIPVSFSNDSPISNECKEQLESYIKPNYPIFWLKQIHSNRVVELPGIIDSSEADGSFTTQKGIVCSVITADCLPIVFSTYNGTMVGIIHAGRKGLANDIISAIVNKFISPRDEIIVWIGPGISQESYLVSCEIREEFIELQPIYKTAFIKVKNGKYRMNLYKIAKIQLEILGIKRENIYGAEWNTFSDPQFHSARRDQNVSGRMATVVWIS